MASRKEDIVQDELNMHSFQTGLIFLLLFVSRWFSVYSIFLAGERRDKVGLSIEHHISDIANSGVIDRVLHVATDFWCLIQYFA